MQARFGRLLHWAGPWIEVDDRQWSVRRPGVIQKPAGEVRGRLAVEVNKQIDPQIRHGEHPGGKRLEDVSAVVNHIRRHEYRTGGRAEHFPDHRSRLPMCLTGDLGPSPHQVYQLLQLGPADPRLDDRLQESGDLDRGESFGPQLAE